MYKTANPDSACYGVVHKCWTAFHRSKKVNEPHLSIAIVFNSLKKVEIFCNCEKLNIGMAKRISQVSHPIHVQEKPVAWFWPGTQEIFPVQTFTLAPPISNRKVWGNFSPMVHSDGVRQRIYGGLNRTWKSTVGEKSYLEGSHVDVGGRALVL